MLPQSRSTFNSATQGIRYLASATTSEAAGSATLAIQIWVQKTSGPFLKILGHRILDLTLASLDDEKVLRSSMV